MFLSTFSHFTSILLQLLSITFFTSMSPLFSSSSMLPSVTSYSPSFPASSSTSFHPSSILSSLMTMLRLPSAFLTHNRSTVASQTFLRSVSNGKWFRHFGKRKEKKRKKSR